jgi:RNA-directed DNA polymerase
MRFMGSPDKLKNNINLLAQKIGYCSQTPGVWRTLDERLRHRLRATQLKHWQRGTTMCRELEAQVAGGDADRLVKTVLTIVDFDRLGVPRLL